MIKKIAWQTFKNTGNIDTYLELKQIENIEENIEKNTSDILIDKTIKKENNIIL
ncbi:MAG: YqzL family protein [Clostridia bacterium]